LHNFPCPWSNWFALGAIGLPLVSLSLALGAIGLPLVSLSLALGAIGFVQIPSGFSQLLMTTFGVY
jgi:hypothetical protein